jgi:hypothetical protein
MKFTVEIPDDIIQWANAEGVNRQMIAKFMREELRNVSSRWGHSPTLNREQVPGESHEWRGFIFNEARVRVTNRITDTIFKVDTGTHGR